MSQRYFQDAFGITDEVIRRVIAAAHPPFARQRRHWLQTAVQAP